MANDGFIEFLSPNALKDLNDALAVVDKLVIQIEKTKTYKAPTTPSGADSTAKEMEKALMAQEKAMEKARIGLQKLADAQKQAESKRIASINAEWAAYEKTKNKEKEASDKLLATEIANAEKSAKAEIDKNNKIIQAAEKRAEREKQIEERKAATILAAQQRQLERQAKIDARNSRTGASSVIPGMGSKIADLKNAEKEAQALEKAALSNQKLNDAYGKLNASRNEAARVLKNLIASETASNAEIKKAQKEFDILNAKVKKADQAVGNFSKNVGNYGSVLSGATQLMSAFGISTGIYLAVDIAKNIFETTKQIQSLDLALRNVSGNQVLFAENQIFIKKTSEDFGIEIKGLQEQFTQFYVAAKDKLSGEQIQNIFRSISKAGAAMGLSVESQNSAFLALQQMMSKGTVQAEELKKQLGNALPGAFNIMATALGVTEKKMMEMMKTGSILSEVALPKFAVALEKAYGIENVERVETMVAAQERLVNSWTNLIRLMTEGDGIISRVATGSITLLTERLESAHLTLKFLEFQWKKVFGGDSAMDSKNKQVNYAIADYKNLSKELNIAIENRDKEIEKLNQLEKIEEKVSGRKKELAQSDIENSKEKLKNLDLIVKKEEEALSTTKAEKLLEVNKKITDEEQRHYLITQKTLKIKELRDTKEQGSSEWNRLNQQIIENNKKVEANNKLLAYNYALRFKLTESAKDNKNIEDPTGESEKAKKAREKKAKDLKKALDDENKLLYENRKKELELELQVINRSLNNNELYYSDRIHALDLAFKKENEILQLTYEYQRKLAGGNLEKQKEALLIFHSSTLKSIEDYNKKREELEKLELQPADFAKGTSAKDQLKEIAEAETRAFEAQVKALNASRKATEDAKKAMDDYAISFAQNFMADAGFSATFDMLSNNIEGFGKDAKITALAITESFQEMFNFIAEMSQRNFEAEKQQLEEQTKIAIAFAGDSDTARAEIERQAEQRRKEIARREFKAKKEQAIFNIAIDTAQAIVGIWAQVPKYDFGVSAALLTAFVGALGLAQIAMVSSQQPPAYKMGTDNHIGGAMLVNDGAGSNYKETIQTPDGKIYQPKERNVIMNAPKGTKVFTHDQWQRNLDNILTSNSINYSQPNVVVNSGMSDEQVDRIVNTIANKQEAILSIDKNGWNTSVRNGHTKKEILNNQVTFGR
jgi:tape measure domain-containing protein